MNYNNINKEDEEFLESLFSAAFVLRASYPDIFEIKKFLEQKKVKIVYYKLSVGKLFIEEEKG